MFRQELVEGFAATDDCSAQRDGVRLAGERPGAGLAGLLVPNAAVPVGIVLAVLEQRTIRFESLSPRLATTTTATAAAAVAAPSTGAFAWTATAVCRYIDEVRGTDHIRRGSLHWD